MEKDGIILYLKIISVINSIIKSFTTENKCESHKKLCENKDNVFIVWTSENTKILEYDQSEKSDKAQFVIYVDIECL